MSYCANYFFSFWSYEKTLVLCEKSLSEFSSNLYVLRPHESEKAVFTKISIYLNLDRIIRLNWALAYFIGAERVRTSSLISYKKIFFDKNCQNRSISCVFEKDFMNKSKISILASDSSHKSLLIILLAFFD